MGLIRFILAVAVIITHSEPLFGLHMTGGRVAVESFYIISGFYMALVLSEKYLQIEKGYRLFITNRFLRLYPAYWVTLIATLIICVVSGVMTGDYFKLNGYLSDAPLHWSSKAYLFASNTGIFGLDASLFTGFDQEGMLQFARDFRQTDPRVHTYLLIPQAWTVSIELMFYLIAPFLVRLKTSWLLVLGAATLGLRLIAYMNGFNFDPWTHRFFPFELIFFIAGILSYRWSKQLRFNITDHRIAYGIIALIVAVVLSFNAIKFPYIELALYILIMVSLPLIFEATKKNKLDNYIGEYSYLIYITHITALFVAMKVIGKFGWNMSYQAEFALGITLVACFLLIRFITDPLERYRKKRVLRAQGKSE